MRIQSPRGTNDILPYDARRVEHTFDAPYWRYLEEVYAATAHNYGYSEIRTPIFEESELFTRSSGDTSEVVTKQMYTFTDKGDRQMALKPEGTAPVIRAFLEHNLGADGGVTKLWYRTEIFRYERPQKGRYRQAHQVGAELLGSSRPEADAELIELAVRFYEALGIDGLVVKINSIGRVATREAYASVILKQASEYLSTLDEEAQARATKNPLRLLDWKDPKMQEALSGLPSILEFLEPESAVHFEAVCSALDRAKISYVQAPEIVRGLDYYNDVVFEVQSELLGAQSTLCGGGRYDNLIKDLGGPATPAIGFAAGIERALIVLETQGKLPALPKLDAYVVAASESCRISAFELANDLRCQGFSIEVDLLERSLKSQFKAADKSNAKFAIVIGEDELANGTVTMKFLADASQISVLRGDIGKVLRQ